MRGSEATVETLRRLGVDVIFGLCGDTTLPLYEALHDLDHGMRHVLTRDERSASYMADAYARLSGKIGVCEGPSGGGATYILPGLAEANGSSAPVVCLTTDIDRADRGRGTLTELDQSAQFRPVTRFTRMPESPGRIEEALREAFRSAATGAMGAARIGLSFDVQSGKTDATLVGGESSSHYPFSRASPEPDEVKSLARLLTEARRPLIVAGAGVVRSEAWEELTSLAHLLGAPVATSIGGKGSIAETDPYALGVIGSNGGLSYRHELVRRADVLFYIGCRQGSVTTEKWTLPANGEKTVLQLDVDPDVPLKRQGGIGWRRHGIDPAGREGRHRIRHRQRHRCEPVFLVPLDHVAVAGRRPQLGATQVGDRRDGAPSRTPIPSRQIPRR